MIRRNRWYWLGLSVELVILLAILSGCMKQPDYKQDFGPEVQFKDIVDSFASMNLPSPEQSKTGEFAYIAASEQIETTSPTVVNQVAYTLNSVTPFHNGATWDVTKQLGELDTTGQMKTSTSEGTVNWCWTTDCTGPSSQSLTLSAKSLKLHAQDDSPGSGGDDGSGDSEKVTYHNLQVTDTTIPVPAIVASRPNCGGLPPDQCHGGISVRKVSFDQVVWNGSVGDKVSVVWTFSEKLPFLASVYPYDIPSPDVPIPGLISSCVQSSVTSQQQVVNVIVCKQVQDFMFGQDPTPTPTPVP